MLVHRSKLFSTGLDISDVITTVSEWTELKVSTTLLVSVWLNDCMDLWGDSASSLILFPGSGQYFNGLNVTYSPKNLKNKQANLVISFPLLLLVFFRTLNRQRARAGLETREGCASTTSLASVTEVLHSQHSVIIAISRNWHLWQEEPSPRQGCVLCVSMLRNTCTFLSQLCSSHVNSFMHRCFSTSCFWSSVSLPNSPINVLLMKMHIKTSLFSGMWSERFILEEVLAGLDLPEPVVLQAKARHDLWTWCNRCSKCKQFPLYNHQPFICSTSKECDPTRPKDVRNSHTVGKKIVLVETD